MIHIIADSTCNLSDELIQKHNIRIAPISIQFGNDSYEEGIDIDRETFYQKIDEMGIIPTTAQPTPSWYAEFYGQIPAGDSALVLTITAKHSGTYDSAVLAKDMVPDADVTIFDTASISLGTGWMIVEAARMAEAGTDLNTILDRLETIRSASSLVLTPETLKYLQMSGRVGRLQGALGSLLSLKPIISVDDGLLAARENVRTRGKAIERLFSLTEEHCGDRPINLGVIYAWVPEEGKQLLAEAKDRFEINEFMIADLVASLAVHGGPGIVGLYAYPVN
jgi:DegV family protein with EDD domain